MSQELLIAWAATLAVTTFIPLVQIAAVKMYSVAPAQDDTDETSADDDAIAEDETPTIAQDDAPLTYVPAPQNERKSARKTARKRKAQKLTPEQRRMQIVESGMDDAATIAAQFNISLRTAQADIAATRDAMLSTNGGAK